jgi:hypothetical protein
MRTGRKEQHATARDSREIGTWYEIPAILICPTALFEETVSAPKPVAQSQSKTEVKPESVLTTPQPQPKPEVKPEVKEIQR